MPSLSGTAEPWEAREAEPMIGGIVPDRMNYVADWRTGLTTTELFLDRSRGDGYLVLLDGRRPEEHIATVFTIAGRLHGIVWRGSADHRDAPWRAGQYEQAAHTIAKVYEVQ
ncbi:hypothetical protein AB0B28_06725 [Glycomyces sp. NPDC046736]|uniref:hypothetical protein n=1 Tax=Glycomyces sp. NPDC046736 TaxID=3155615 RepID=UPI00340BC059